MSDVEFVWRLTTLGVHWRFKETLQWSEPDLFTMPRGKGDSWQFGHRWGEFCHFRLSLTFASSCIGSLKRWEVFPHNFKTLSFVLKQVEGSSFTSLYSDKTTFYSRKITIRKINTFTFHEWMLVFLCWETFGRSRETARTDIRGGNVIRFLSPLRRCLHNTLSSQLCKPSVLKWGRSGAKHEACARVSAPTLVSRICTRSQTAIPHTFSS